ncbi:MAG: hypothetical protein Q7U04_09090 [Bacteriovorax sp.]|nr:hypothetical protein [Bacteriovorax sp.]
MKIFWTFAFLFLGCSFSPSKRERLPNSSTFSCHFNKIINGNQTDFIFIPENQLLIIKSNILGETKILLEESDFTPGGYIYKGGRAENYDNWKLSLELISYRYNPKIKIDIQKSLLSSLELKIESRCLSIAN